MHYLDDPTKFHVPERDPDLWGTNDHGYTQTDLCAVCGDLVPAEGLLACPVCGRMVCGPLCHGDDGCTICRKMLSARTRETFLAFSRALAKVEIPIAAELRRRLRGGVTCQDSESR